MPNCVARPDRGLSCASYPDGTATAKPHGIKALPPGSIRIVDFTAALTSIPAAPMDSYAGSAMSSQPDMRLIGTETSDFNTAFYPIRSDSYDSRNRDLASVSFADSPWHPSSCHSHEGKATLRNPRPERSRTSNASGISGTQDRCQTRGLAIVRTAGTSSTLEPRMCTQT